MNPSIIPLFFLGIVLGTGLVASSSHWLLAWMGLEINTLAIIPLMIQNRHPRAVEATTKYFITQATAAAVLLAAATANAWLTGQWNIYEQAHEIPTLMIISALALKLGLAPLHLWLPEVLQGLDLNTGLLLSTWQKLAPFLILTQMPLNDNSLLIVLGLSSTLVGGWGGLNQTQLRKIMAYSSTAHLGWMILIVKYAPALTMFTLVVYWVMTSSAFLTFKFNKAYTINALGLSWADSPLMTSMVPLILFSLAGLPPMTGFAPKMLILQELTKQDLGTTALLTALTALLGLYFYLRLSHAIALTLYPNNLTGIPRWRLHNCGPPALLVMLTFSAVLLLPLTPSITALFTP
uniref:NADH-ubiquinone oxidoreductase chain 2 n=2 Tax=Clupeocephala TaxID=186625 RepID=I7BDP8_9GOBI|nr:NADH dehydrogenase subunit 2 [Acanthogobius hasta]QBM09590.1 NADH dehydrogenase subunit 2 [Acanthogobius hasta]UFA49350.1 NADH dehydrogenase subunit 2 [Netuma thalassina]